MSSTPQKKLLKTKSDFKTSVGSFQIESKCLQHLKKSSLKQNPTSKHPLDHFRSSPNVFNASKKAPNNKVRLQNIRWIISDLVQMSSTPQKKLLKTKSDFKTSVGSFQIESKCLQRLKQSSLQQNPTAKHPLDHFRSSPNVFNTSKKAPNDKIRLQNIRWIISDRVQMSSTPQKKLLTNSKHPLDHFRSSPNVFNTSKKAPNDKIRLQNIRWIISDRVQMSSTPQKKLLTTKSDFKTSVGSFQIESKCLQRLKKSLLTTKNIRWIISDRVRMSSTPQKKLLTTKSDFKTSVGSFQIESKCLQRLKKSS